MAVMVPRDPPPGAEGSELKVRTALESLPDDWIVLHQVRWQSVRNGRPGDGEADFVLVNRNHGMLVVEVKGGGVRLDAGRWSSIDRHGSEHRTKDPFEQATSSKHALVSYLKQRGVSTLPAGHLVVFPDLGTLTGLGPAAPSEITWTRTDLRSASEALVRTIRHWGLSKSIPVEFVSRIRSLLAPTVVAKPLLREAVADVNEELIRLTDEQIVVMSGLRRNRRAVIYGGPGTGKTVLAVEQARRLSRDGFSVLLTCFNRPLADLLADTVVAGHDDAPITVGTFHNVCSATVRDAGLPSPKSKTQEWWDTELPALLPQAAEAVGRRFGAVVVDEGQDFDPSWWISLQLVLRDPDDGPMYVFSDAQQAIYRRGWQPPFEQPAFELEINCRNSLPIARRVSSVFGGECTTLGTGGPEPRYRVAESPSEVGTTLKTTLDELIDDQGLGDDQLVVLSGKRDVVDVLRGRTLGEHRLVGPGGQGIVVETVHRFKGLESDVALLVFSSYDETLDDALAYIGMSRARAHLEIIGPARLAERLGWVPD
jgi:hypothetical protein